MSYTSSDPENFNRDFDSNSTASASNATSQPKAKKKPWSKFKSSIKSIGDKMSSKPKFPEQAEGGEQKKSKKIKKSKSSGSSDEVKPPADGQKEKSATLGKTLVKKISVETLATPYVGYQPKSVTPVMSYAKALNKSGSTSESNLSASDLESPRKVVTLDKNTKYSLTAQESPDSGRVSQDVEGRGASSDFSADSDYTMGPQRNAVSSLDTPVPDNIKETITDISTDFIKSETKVNNPNPVLKTESKGVLSETEIPLKNKIIEGGIEDKEKLSETGSEDLLLKKSNVEETTKTKKTPQIQSNTSDNANIDFIKSEQSKVNIQISKDKDKLSQDSKSENIENPKSTGSSKNESDGAISDMKEDKSKDVQSKTNENEKDIAFVSKTDTTKPDTKEDESKDVQTKQIEQVKDSTIVSKSDTTIAEKVADTNLETNKNITTKPDSEEKSPDGIVSKDSSTVTSKSEENKQTTKQEENNETNNDAPESKVDKKEGKETSDAKETPISLQEENEPPKSETSADTNMASTSSKSTKEVSQTPKMSVEEKLEAFLSSEGWSGTIKDIAVKAGNSGSQQPDKRECLYKILVIGELGTGKTSIIKRYVHQFFSQHYRATIGVDFALKVLNWDPNTIIRLQLWDIAGQERFGNMTRVYYKEAVGAFIVFDVTRSATFDAVLKWKQDLDSKVQLADGSSIPCVLLANKCDQQKEGIVNTPAKMEDYCKENNFSAWFETSAKENINIDEAAKSLVTQILQNDKMSQNGRDSAREGGKFPLDEKSEQEGKSCAC